MICSVNIFDIYIANCCSDLISNLSGIQLAQMTTIEDISIFFQHPFFIFFGGPHLPLTNLYDLITNPSFPKPHREQCVQHVYCHGNDLASQLDRQIVRQMFVSQTYRMPQHSKWRKEGGRIVFFFVGQGQHKLPDANNGFVSPLYMYIGIFNNK